MPNRIKNGDYFHITYNNNQWQIKEVKNYKIKTYSTKEEAINEAKKMVEKSKMGYIVVHDEKGKFEALNN